VTRRHSLPGADELFRPTGPAEGVAPSWYESGRGPAHHAATDPSRRGTPRQKHTSKITVYVSDDELLALEHARLALRAKHGLAVDRGRVVREAIAVVIADLEERGEESVLVRRLRHDE
jgi:L-aminopeptidase/D-esterase-like protein